MDFHHYGAEPSGNTQRDLASERPRGSKKKTHSRRALWLWIVAVFATATAFIVHLAVRFETVHLGYAVSEARKEQQALIEMKRTLAVEAATLRQATRVEAVAHGVLGMDVPDPSRIIPIRGKQRGDSNRSVR